MIVHRPILDTAVAEQIYTERDGVPVKYVCTSAITLDGDYSGDIFYRETPHPEFGNRYFMLFSRDREWLITNADNIENLDFEMVSVNDQLHYSQHRHDFYSIADTAIDGGRAYFRRLGNLSYPRFTMRVVDGQFVHKNV